MKLQPRGEYPRNWPEIATAVKAAAGWCCIRCAHPHDFATHHVLTVHHLDGDKSNCRWWNLLALCQRCHLEIQGKVNPAQVYLHEHSEWFKVYVAGYYAFTVLGVESTREQVEPDVERLLRAGQPWLYEEAR